jgi:hypothetical protein
MSTASDRRRLENIARDMLRAAPVGCDCRHCVGGMADRLRDSLKARELKIVPRSALTEGEKS